MTDLENPPTVWSEPRKILFRFICVYLLFYVCTDGVMALIIHATPLVGFWDALINLAGRTVFGIEEITVKPNGSGDTTYNYVQLFVIVCLSIIITLAWGRIDREKANHEKMANGLRVFIRYYLAYIMIVYGLAKVFKTQFPYPTFEMLTRTYGESSPMGLLWTFMGLSYPYNLFTGMGEVLGGALLFFRKTTLLGSLVIVGVMSNVVVLNFSYDVPVKIYSTHLLLMAVFLMWPDLKRLQQFFISNQPVEPAPIVDLGLNKTLVKVGRTVGILVLAGLVGMNVYFYIKMPEMMARGQQDGELYGQYKVLHFEPEGLLLDERWTELAVYGSHVDIKTQNGSTQRITWNVDSDMGTLDVFAHSDSMTSSILHYSQPTDSLLLIDGWFKGDSISVSLRPVKDEDFLLISRGFHWINEYPYNR